MNFPACFAALVSCFSVIALASSAIAADCDIDGGWSDTEYVGGDNMIFSGTISPSSGFIKAYIENPLGDKIYTLPSTQINSTYRLTFETSQTHLNGTYRARVYYDLYPNGTECGQSLSEATNLITNNTDGALNISINLSQTYATTPFSIDGAPVDTPLGTITSKITGSAVPGLVPSFKISGTQLAPGANIGDIDIQLSSCQNNQNILDSVTSVSAFLNSSLVELEVCKEGRITDSVAISDLNTLVENKTQEITARDERIAEYKAGDAFPGKIHTIWGIVFFIPMGMILLVLIQQQDNAVARGRSKKPLQYESRNRDKLIKL